MKEHQLGEMLVNQSNLILDAIEGKKTIEEVTSFLGANYVGVAPLRERLKSMIEPSLTYPISSTSGTAPFIYEETPINKEKKIVQKQKSDVKKRASKGKK